MRFVKENGEIGKRHVFQASQYEAWARRMLKGLEGKVLSVRELKVVCSLDRKDVEHMCSIGLLSLVGEEEPGYLVNI
jgi:hypothetical protein